MLPLRRARAVERMLWITSIVLVWLVASDPAVQAQDGSTAETGMETAPSAPELVAEGGYGWPALALGPDGERHIVMTELAKPGAGHRSSGDLWYATDRDGSWVLRRLLKGNRDHSGLGWDAASIAVDRDGSVHIAVVHDYIGNTPSATEGIYYLTDVGREPGDFGPRTRIAPPGTWEPSLAVVDGARYLVYGRVGLLGDPPPPTPVFLKTDHAGAWETVRLAGDGYGPRLAIDGVGGVHIVYVAPVDDGLRGDLRHATYDTATGVLSSFRQVPGPTGDWYDTLLAADASGQPHLAWMADRAITWQRRTAGGWDRPEKLPVRSLQAASLEVDAGGRPHLVFVGRSDAGRGVIHAQRVAGRWHEEVIVEGVAWAAIATAVDERGLSVTWAPPGWSSVLGLWSYGPFPATDPAVQAAGLVLEGLLAGAADMDCTPFTEEGDNDPFSCGALAAIECPVPVRGVRHVALFRFPDPGALAAYWAWRIEQAQPLPASRDRACSDDRPGRARWEHGDVFCYVSALSGEAKLRWTDERTYTYVVLDGRGRDIAGLHDAWIRLREPTVTSERADA